MLRYVVPLVANVTKVQLCVVYMIYEIWVIVLFDWHHIWCRICYMVNNSIKCELRCMLCDDVCYISGEGTGVGLGGCIETVVDVIASEILTVIVGGEGGNAVHNKKAIGGLNGGGKIVKLRVCNIL